MQCQAVIKFLSAREITTKVERLMIYLQDNIQNINV